MAEWKNISPPNEDDSLNDHDVFLKSNYLKNKRIALCVTGSIAAIKTPSLARTLRKHGADVQIFVTQEGLKCGCSLTALEWGSYPNPVITEITSASEHLSIENSFDLYLVAPATANTIAKISSGISDTVVTASIASALGRKIPIVIVPAMHGSLHTTLLTESIKKLQSLGVYFVKPYDAFGKHNFPSKEEIIIDCSRVLSNSPLKGIPILVTSGPTPVHIDNVRLITNKFSGKLGILIATELLHRGADVTLLQSKYGIRPPHYIPHSLHANFKDYAYQTEKESNRMKNKFGIYSAAVADYCPVKELKGKTPSKGALKSIELTETYKVIDKILESFHVPHMVTLKYEEGVGYNKLSEIAKERIKRGHKVVVATDGRDCGERFEQKAHIFYQLDDGSISIKKDIIGKEKIAFELANCLEIIEKENAQYVRH